MTTLAILKAARELLSDPANWRGGSAGAKGFHCVATAIFHVKGNTNMSPAQRALAKAAGVEDPTCALFNWNDAPERTHADVLAAFDRAIEAES